MQRNQLTVKVIVRHKALKTMMMLLSCLLALSLLTPIVTSSSGTTNGRFNLFVPAEVSDKLKVWFDYMLPFKFDGSTVVGIKRNNNQPRAFVKTTKDLEDKGVLALEADFGLDDQKLQLASKWALKTKGFIGGITAALGFKDEFSAELKELSAIQELDSSKLVLDYKLNWDTKILSGTTSYDWKDVGVLKVKADSKIEDPLLSLSRKVSDNDKITPGVYLKTGKPTFGVSRKWIGGSIDLTADTKQSVFTSEWKDETATGAWYTKLNTYFDAEKKGKAEVTVRREWVE